MKKITLAVPAIAVWALLVGATAATLSSNPKANAKEPDMITESVTVDGVTLTLTCPKVLMSGERNLVTITIQNNSVGPVEYWSLDNLVPLAFEVSSQGKPVPKLLEEQVRTCTGVWGTKAPMSYTLKKGGKLEYKANFSCLYDLSVLGHYEICALWTGTFTGNKESTTLKTPPIKCEVHANNEFTRDGSTPLPETRDLTKAIALTAATLQGKVRSPAEYKLIKVEMTWIKGKYAWLATYKPLNLLPDDPSKAKIGKGGEVFVNVDLMTEQAEVRHGE